MRNEVTIFPAQLELPLQLLVELAEEAEARHTSISAMLSTMLIEVANEREAAKNPLDVNGIPPLTPPNLSFSESLTLTPEQPH